MSNIDPATILTQRTDQTVIVDVREADEYAAGHVPGAINVPLSELIERHNEIPDGIYFIVRK